MTGRVRRSRGYTLLETLAVTAIATLLVAGAAPSFNRLLQTRALTAQADEFTAALRYARSEAVKRGEPVSVCARSGQADPSAALCAASAQADWQAGWVVFVDRQRRGRIDDGDRVLKVQQPLQHTGGVVASGGVSSTKEYLTYQPSGWSLNAASHYGFLAPATRWAEAGRYGMRLVCVSKQGRARVAPAGATAC